MALPEDEYLLKIGTVAYLISALEGLLLFDLPRLGLPEGLQPGRLGRDTTSSIGNQLRNYAQADPDHPASPYLAEGGRALVELSTKRNAVLHARPATDDDGHQRLYRWHPAEQFLISDDWLDRLTADIQTAHQRVIALRPPLPPQ